jgi:hypothetical protein
MINFVFNFILLFDSLQINNSVKIKKISYCMNFIPYFSISFLLLLTLSFISANAQELENEEPHKLDSINVAYEENRMPIKILHAEPLYIDLIRDLGARKGEKEWNVGMGLTDKLNYDSYEMLVEYEWAPIDRLGLEIEVPVTINSRPKFNPNLIGNGNSARPPSNRVESLKLAFQYTFLVNQKLATSLAIGGITEFEFTDLDQISTSNLMRGMLYNPFFIAAKRWGNDFHTLLYTGPRISQEFGETGLHYGYEINSNFHYMIPGTRNFIGIEVNQIIENGQIETVFRPQMRLVINEGIMVGIVPGIPASFEKERMSSFVRLIYEPREKHHKPKHR